MNEVKSKPI